ncbi:unnamed protein product [Polarella glacialis]|uniref:Uncharacterized protein n=1 Tax=Polarella glacialis TaxID=89957 RepID=A0A813H9Y3_POLGL|nr:unnamed protein product [Polarella glacialis]
MADELSGALKIIDPEFVIYGPPGLDVGSLLSGYALATAALAANGRLEEASAVRDAAVKVWESYLATLTSLGVGSAAAAKAGEDAAGFAACEVARTALGFAGLRGLSSVLDGAKKAEAEAALLRLAQKCVLQRKARGVQVILDELSSLLTLGC